jgi:trehalose 6-phosphate synthase/phosphatase
LAADPKNMVWIISGRDGEFLEHHLGHIENLGFSAEHGGFIRERGSKEWQNLTQRLDMTWMNEVLDIFKYYTEVMSCIQWVRSAEGADILGVENHRQSY